MARTQSLSTLQHALERERQARLKKDPNRYRLPKKVMITIYFTSAIWEDDEFITPKLYVKEIEQVIHNICYDFNVGYQGPINDLWRTENTWYINIGFSMFGQDNKPQHGIITWDFKTGNLQAFIGLDKDGEEYLYYGDE